MFVARHLAPVPADSPEFDGREERQIGKAVGMIQFGVNYLMLSPGATSSRRHWHEAEDEFVFVLSGRVSLVDENGEHELIEDAFAGFPRGLANGQNLINRSQDTAKVLVGGTREVGKERVHYPGRNDHAPS